MASITVDGMERKMEMKYKLGVSEYVLTWGTPTPRTRTLLSSCDNKKARISVCSFAVFFGWGWGEGVVLCTTILRARKETIMEP